MEIIICSNKNVILKQYIIIFIRILSTVLKIIINTGSYSTKMPLEIWKKSAITAAH